MEDLNQIIGGKIRYYRKQRDLTIQQLADSIHKGKSVVSKYEIGQTAIDIVTLYEIAEALKIRVDQLLYIQPSEERVTSSETAPVFFRGLDRFFMYFYDGRNLGINRSVVDVHSSDDSGGYAVMLYMNIENYENYHNAENTYWGTLRHYDVMSSLILNNRDNPMEKLSINVPSPFLDTTEKWGLFFGISSRPLMPVSLKVLITKEPVKETKELIERLKISKEDIRLMKLYNMLTIT